MISLLLGLAAVALVGFVMLWLWGSWAFSPKDQSHLRRLAQGDFVDGLRYEVTSEGRTFGAARYYVNIGTRESGANACAVFVEEGGPKPTAVRHAKAERIEVEFERPLADGSRMLAATLGDDRFPAEIVIVSAQGSVRRQPAR